MSKKQYVNLTPQVFKSDFMEGLVQALANETNELENAKSETKIAVPVDIIVKDNGYLMRMDIPGVKLDDVDIAIENGVLMVEGEKQLPLTDFNDKYQLKERPCGRFKRSFKLSNQIDVEKITADYTAGILEIILPKKTRDIISVNKETLPC